MRAGPHWFERWGFPLFKYGVFALLTFNIYLFLRHATVREALDSLGWVILLLLFEWETRRPTGLPLPRSVIALQAFAYVTIVFALYRFALHIEDKPLDFYNAFAWILVAVGIEFDIHRPATRGTAAYQLRFTAKYILYGFLCLLAAIWGLRSEVLNFYDALLWILCFFAVELNQVRRHHGR
jgi:hypothetical protein